MKKTVGILTPAYNRAYIMDVLFESLLAQTSYDFTWYIVDDGSTDDTKEKCESFKTDKFDIIYKYKENGGKHTVLNMGADIIEEELMFVVDSDDYITPDAVETIVRDWEKYKADKMVGGLSYYKLHNDMSVIGDSYESDEPFVDSYINVRINSHIIGDKAEVVKTELMKKHKSPVFEGEKHVGTSVVWSAIARAGNNFAFIPKGIYICEYLDDGLTRVGKKKNLKNPNGYLAHTAAMLHDDIKTKLQWKYAVAYVATSFFAKKKVKEAFRECPQKGKFVCAFLPGCLLYGYWKKKWGKEL